MTKTHTIVAGVVSVAVLGAFVTLAVTGSTSPAALDLVAILGPALGAAAGYWFHASGPVREAPAAPEKQASAAPTKEAPK